MAETNPNAQLVDSIAPLLKAVGYDLVFLEVLTHRQKTLRLFIEHLDLSKGAIGVEDCALVSRTLDEPLDQMPEIEALFKGPYELEVSSPGVDRPLRSDRDFARFHGRQARIHVYRPLTADELQNPDFAKKHPKQKNFLGKLEGVDGEKVLIAVLKDDGSLKSRKTNSGKSGRPDVGTRVTIPLPLISKANLEPIFDWSTDEEGIEL